jgi:hypothetical protein
MRGAWLSDANERLDQPADQALQLDVALQRHDANARRAVLDHRTVFDCFVGFVEVALAITAELVPERALKHASPFCAIERILNIS